MAALWLMWSGELDHPLSTFDTLICFCCCNLFYCGNIKQTIDPHNWSRQGEGTLVQPGLIIESCTFSKNLIVLPFILIVIWSVPMILKVVSCKPHFEGCKKYCGWMEIWFCNWFLNLSLLFTWCLWWTWSKNSLLQEIIRERILVYNWILSPSIQF